MVCPTSCLPYIDWWPQNVSFVTSGSPYFMFALSEMSLPYVHVCPTGHVALHGNFFHPNETFVTSGSPYFMFALSERSLPYLHVCPTENVALPNVFFSTNLKIFVRSVTNVVGIYLWYIMYHLYLWYEYTILNLCVAN